WRSPPRSPTPTAAPSWSRSPTASPSGWPFSTCCSAATSPPSPTPARPRRSKTMSKTLIRGAKVLGGTAQDVLIDAGTVAEVGTGLSAEGAEVVEADGKVLLPGLVDLHTHLREPGREDSETVLTGTRAAASGGYTAVFAMANTFPVADTAGVVEQVWRLGKEHGYCDVRPVGAVTVGLEGQKLAELGAMHESAAGVTVFSDDGKCVHDAVIMRRALEYVKAFDGVVAQHAQEPRLTEGAEMNEGVVSAELGLGGWPAVAGESIIARDVLPSAALALGGRPAVAEAATAAGAVLLADHVGSRVHIRHLSTAGSVEIVRGAKARGIRVTAAVTPHHLLLPHELVRPYNPVYKV